jgi:hypothetical protein
MEQEKSATTRWCYSDLTIRPQRFLAFLLDDELHQQTRLADALRRDFTRLCTSPLLEANRNDAFWCGWERMYGDLLFTLERGLALAKENGLCQAVALQAVLAESAHSLFRVAALGPPLPLLIGRWRHRMVPLLDHHLLPARPGVYCAHFKGEFIYTGSSRNLKKRWAGGHHRFAQIFRFGPEVLLSWMVLPSTSILCAEQNVAYLLRPCLNERAIERRRSRDR